MQKKDARMVDFKIFEWYLNFILTLNIKLKIEGSIGNSDQQISLSLIQSQKHFREDCKNVHQKQIVTISFTNLLWLPLDRCLYGSSVIFWFFDQSSKTHKTRSLSIWSFPWYWKSCREYSSTDLTLPSSWCSKKPKISNQLLLSRSNVWRTSRLQKLLTLVVIRRQVDFQRELETFSREGKGVTPLQGMKTKQF